MFIDSLRESSSLCAHPNENFQLDQNDHDLRIRCRTCGHAVSVSDFLCSRASPLWSATLAREFAGETGIVHVPCKFRLDQFEDSLLPETVVTRLSTVLRGYEMLKAIHSPFVRGDPTERSVDPRLFRTLMSEYMTLIDRVSAEGERSGGGGKLGVETVKSILTNMKDAFSNVDMFDQYFNVLAPYVKRAAVACQTTVRFEEDGRALWYSEVEKHRSAPLGIALDRELALCAEIRKNYSGYCIPFDVVYAMVLCYVCGDNIDLVHNIVFDLAAKLCCGYFSFRVWEAFPTGSQIRRFIDLNFKPRLDLKMHQHLQKYKQEKGVVEDFSEDFLRQYGELESGIRKHVPSADSKDRIERFVYQQTFPYMLFEKTHGDDFDYYAFTMALAHYASKSTLGSRSIAIGSIPGTSVPKGVVAECKHIYSFVKTCMNKIKNFDVGPEKIYWTKDMFHLFIASDKGFENELNEVIQIMV